MAGFGPGVDGPATGCTTSATSGASGTSGTSATDGTAAIGAGSSTSIGVSSSVCDEGSSSAGMFRTARGGEPSTATGAAGASAEVPSSEDRGGWTRPAPDELGRGPARDSEGDAMAVSPETALVPGVVLWAS